MQKERKKEMKKRNAVSQALRRARRPPEAVPKSYSLKGKRPPLQNKHFVALKGEKCVWRASASQEAE